MNLTNIIKAITGPKGSKRTAAELRADLAAIDLVALEAVVTDIESRRRDLLLTGSNDELRAITDELSQANLDAERGQAVVDELTRLIKDAAEREAREAIERVADGANAARTQLLHLYGRADELAGELAAVLQEITQARATLKDAAKRTTDAGRPDLRVRDPIGALATHLGHASSDALVDPLTWHLRHYWPLRDGNGFPLKVDRSLGRARELLDNLPAKKAA